MHDFINTSLTPSIVLYVQI